MKPYIRVIAARRTDTMLSVILQTPNGGSLFKSWPRDLEPLVLQWIELNVENPLIKWQPTI